MDRVPLVNITKMPDGSLIGASSFRYWHSPGVALLVDCVSEQECADGMLVKSFPSAKRLASLTRGVSSGASLQMSLASNRPANRSRI
jgi:hypothetical protein